MREEKIYSEELREIIGAPPKWLVRSGVKVILLFFLSILIFSIFFKYPVVVNAKLVILTTPPPVNMIAKADGTISKLFVENEMLVDSNTVLALIDNTSDYEEIIQLKSFLDSLGNDWVKNVTSSDLPYFSNLGDLQKNYTQFRKLWYENKLFYQNDYYANLITNLDRQLHKKEELYERLLEERAIRGREIEFIKNNFQRDSVLYSKSASVILPVEYERTYQNYLSALSNYKSFETSIKNIESSMLGLNRELIEVKRKNLEERYNLDVDLEETFQLLINQIALWEEKYLLVSPINGKVTFSQYWSENQYVARGDNVLAVVPGDSMKIIGKILIPSSGIGNVMVGQDVNIKLSGFPYTKYGIIHGSVSSISLVPTEDGYYGEVELPEGMLSSYKERLKFVQQMDGTADIITYRERLIMKFISPIRSVVVNQ